MKQQHTDPPADYRPFIPIWLRTAVYAIGVLVGASTILVMSTAYEWLEPATANRAIVTMGGISSATSFLASTLGIAYRPGHTAPPTPTDPEQATTRHR